MKKHNLFKRVNRLLKERAWEYWRGQKLRKTEAREHFLDTRKAVNPGTHNSDDCLHKIYKIKAANISARMGEGYMSFQP